MENPRGYRKDGISQKHLDEKQPAEKGHVKTGRSKKGPAEKAAGVDPEAKAKVQDTHKTVSL
jgi:hypothetical protein